MMQAIREYLLAITAAALICGIAVRLLPDGVAGAAAKMVCGLLMCMAILGPIADIQLNALKTFGSEMDEQAHSVAQVGVQQAQTALREGISEKTRAYILDKARSLGAELTVEVELTEEQLPVPFRITLFGNVSPYARSVLSEYIREHFRVEGEEQVWIS